MKNVYLVFCATIILIGLRMGMVHNGEVVLSNLKMFTYQSNLAMVVGFFALITVKGPLRQYILVAVVLATTVTGLVYNFVLVPFAGAPRFYSDFVNFSTHVLVTIFPLVFYFLFEEKGKLKCRHIFAGMVFPMVYWVVFVTIGERIDFFPYFFMNPHYVGWGMTFVWFGALLAPFAVLGFLLLWYDGRRLVSANRT